MASLHLIRLAVLLGTPLLANAQAATLHDAFAQAWAVQAEQQTARDRQFSAQVTASHAWTPKPPSLGLSNSTDQFNDDRGRLEWEVRLTAPIWLPGQRAQAQGVAQAEKIAFDGRSELSRWQLAGQLRESWWAVRFSEVELASATRQLEQAQALASDVRQRVKAGELAALDENQAKIAIAQAKRQQGQARLDVQRSRETFALLSNGAALPEQFELLEPAPAIKQHPLLDSLQAAALSAQARLEQATGDTRDAPELSLGYATERDVRAAPYQSKIKLGVTIPFGSESRNRPRIEAANADWIEARTNQEVAQRQITAELNAARLELDQSQQLLALAREELQLIDERSAWIAKGFRLGQLDLQTHMRSQLEQREAQAQLTRAEYARGRAISRFNQAAGVLP